MTVIFNFSFSSHSRQIFWTRDRSFKELYKGYTSRLWKACCCLHRHGLAPDSRSGQYSIFVSYYTVVKWIYILQSGFNYFLKSKLHTFFNIKKIKQTKYLSLGYKFTLYNKLTPSKAIKPLILKGLLSLKESAKVLLKRGQ